MYSTLSLVELEDRIAIVRDNLRQLVEQAAASSGSQNEERTADRIAQQEEELNKLTKSATAAPRNKPGPTDRSNRKRAPHERATGCWD